jgi:hypothetical protein
VLKCLLDKDISRLEIIWWVFFFFQNIIYFVRIFKVSANLSSFAARILHCWYKFCWIWAFFFSFIIFSCIVIIFFHMLRKLKIFVNFDCVLPPSKAKPTRFHINGFFQPHFPEPGHIFSIISNSFRKSFRVSPSKGV